MRVSLLDLVGDIKIRSGATTPDEAMALIRAIGRYAALTAALATVVNDAVESMFPNGDFPPMVCKILLALTQDMEAVRSAELPDAN